MPKKDKLRRRIMKQVIVLCGESKKSDSLELNDSMAKAVPFCLEWPMPRRAGVGDILGRRPDVGLGSVEWEKCYCTPPPH